MERFTNDLNRVKEFTNNILDTLKVNYNDVEKVIKIRKYEDNRDIRYTIILNVKSNGNFSEIDKEKIEDLINKEDNIRYLIYANNIENNEIKKAVFRSNSLCDEEKSKEYLKKIFKKTPYEVNRNRIKAGWVFDMILELPIENRSSRFYAHVYNPQFSENENTEIYFEIARLLCNLFDENLDMERVYLESLDLKFYITKWDKRLNKPILVNILQRYEIKKAIAFIYSNRITDRYDIKNIIEQVIEKEFETNEDYIIKVSKENSEAVEFKAYDQIKPNIDAIVNYLYTRIYKK